MKNQLTIEERLQLMEKNGCSLNNIKSIKDAIYSFGFHHPFYGADTSNKTLLEAQHEYIDEMETFLNDYNLL